MNMCYPGYWALTHFINERSTKDLPLGINSRQQSLSDRLEKKLKNTRKMTTMSGGLNQHQLE